MVVNIVLASLACLSLVLGVWQWVAARNFPLHRRTPRLTDLPPVTVLKPLKGTESATKECLRSWFQQQYPSSVQILFGIASENDPAGPLVQELIQEYPDRDAELVICEKNLGANAKVSTLVQLMIFAKHNVIVISDADVHAPGDGLANVVIPLVESNVGLVTCLYRFANPSSLAMHWEAVAINADFWSQVLQSQTLKPIDFALGAVMAARRESIVQIGGLGVLLNFLADDYQLGKRISQLEKRIHLSSVVVDCWSAPQDWSQVWKHQLRWARTIRVSEPVPFFFSILSNPTIWPLLAVAAVPAGWVAALAAVCLVARGLTAYDNQSRILGAPPKLLSVLMIWPKDLFSAVIWLWAFLGNRLEWRGEKFRVRPGGELVRDF